MKKMSDTQYLELLKKTSIKWLGSFVFFQEKKLLNETLRVLEAYKERIDLPTQEKRQEEIKRVEMIQICIKFYKKHKFFPVETWRFKSLLDVFFRFKIPFTKNIYYPKVFNDNSIERYIDERMNHNFQWEQEATQALIQTLEDDLLEIETRIKSPNRANYEKIATNTSINDSSKKWVNYIEQMNEFKKAIEFNKQLEDKLYQAEEEQDKYYLENKHQYEPNQEGTGYIRL